jgi:hypothetical protein
MGSEREAIWLPPDRGYESRFSATIFVPGKFKERSKIFDLSFIFGNSLRWPSSKGRFLGKAESGRIVHDSLALLRTLLRYSAGRTLPAGRKGPRHGPESVGASRAGSPAILARHGRHLRSDQEAEPPSLPSRWRTRRPWAGSATRAKRAGRSFPDRPGTGQLGARPWDGIVPRR